MKPLSEVVVDDEKTIADLAREQRERVYREQMAALMIETIHKQGRAIREHRAEIGVLEQALEDAEYERGLLRAEVARLRGRR